MATNETLDYLRAVRHEYWEFVSDFTTEANILFGQIKKSNPKPPQGPGEFGGKGGMVPNVQTDVWEFRYRSTQFTLNRWGATSDIKPTQPQQLVNCGLEMGGYRVDYAMRLWEEMSMGGDTQYINLTRHYDTSLMIDFVQLLEKELYQNNYSSTPRGWGGSALWLAQTGTYANGGSTTGIDLTNTALQPYLFNFSGSGETLANNGIYRLTDAYTQVCHGDSQGMGNRSTLTICSRGDWVTLKNALMEQHRIVHINEETYKQGFIHFEHDFVPVFWSDQFTDLALNRIEIFNTRYIGIAHATNKMFHSFDEQGVAGGVPGRTHVVLNKSQVFCTDTHRQAVLTNTNAS